VIVLSPEALRDFQVAYYKDRGVELPLEEIEIKVRECAELLRILLRPMPRDKYLLWLKQLDTPSST